MPIIDKSKIKEIMSKKHIKTQTELAKKMGVTKSQLSFLLSNSFEPVKQSVIRLAETLDMSPMDIIEDSSVERVKEPTYNSQKTNINVLELFAGGGGLALGLEKAGLNTKALIEIDEDCCKTLRINRPEWNVINEDIREIDFRDFKVKDIDVITGGFPCQAFSYAGKKLGFEDTRGTLFFEFARAVKQLQPKLFVAENVRGILNHDKGKTLVTILKVLSDFGYDVKYKLLNSVNYFVPQKRQRVFIIGTKPGYEFGYPKPFDTIKTIRDALKDCPSSKGAQYSEKRRKVYELVPPGGYWRDLPEEVAKDFMGKSYYSGGGRTGMARRMSWNEPCLTVMTSPAQKQTERIHPEETRPFTVRENARIQTFPDDWEFLGSMYSQYKQVGNAVPVKLAYFIGKAIKDSIRNIKKTNKKDDIKESNAQLAFEANYKNYEENW